MATAQDIALLFDEFAARDGLAVDRRRRQSLLYFAQGWCLAWYGRPLFPEAVEAWPEGPVVAAVERGESRPTGAALRRHERRTAARVWDHLKRHDDDALARLVLAEPAWRDAYDAGPNKHGLREISVEKFLGCFGARFDAAAGGYVGFRPPSPPGPDDDRLYSHDEVVNGLGS